CQQLIHKRRTNNYNKKNKKKKKMFDLSDFAKMTNSDSEDEQQSKDVSVAQQYEEKMIPIRDEELTIREFHFSATNAGYVWPSTFFIIDYMLEHQQMFTNKRIIEIGSGTGILSLFLTWGDKFPEDRNNFDVVIASDIILYVAYFEKLMITLRQLMDHRPDSFMIMAYKRKLYNSKNFFVLLTDNGFEFESIGSKMWIIRKKKVQDTQSNSSSNNTVPE
ncbi:hypothetical protein SAMD00019534_000260, partial [Acytostelium subglobosum LB1]|uniref:hypothetical protein n=1 Tax=Acytostelium subglobosum LB1 TaxID=1410327 RepID=UPI000644BE8D